MPNITTHDARQIPRNKHVIVRKPGDFDADLTEVDPRYVKAHVSNPNAKLTIVLGVEDEDAERLQQLAARSHKRPAEVFADLLRNAWPWSLPQHPPVAALPSASRDVAAKSRADRLTRATASPR